VFYKLSRTAPFTVAAICNIKSDTNATSGPQIFGSVVLQICNYAREILSIDKMIISIARCPTDNTKPVLVTVAKMSIVIFDTTNRPQICYPGILIVAVASAALKGVLFIDRRLSRQNTMIVNVSRLYCDQENFWTFVAMRQFIGN
jgi:hypothetical protein